MSDEQRVRTAAGWIGVEISKSRVRTAGKAGYGLYRVRGSGPAVKGRAVPAWVAPSTVHGPGSWTGYLFTLEVIWAGVLNAIAQGRPGGPLALHLAGSGPDGGMHVVPTMWTSAYRGRRDLGARPRALLVGDGSTVRQRQREQNARFQAEHLEARSAGLRARHGAKLARNAANDNASRAVDGL